MIFRESADFRRHYNPPICLGFSFSCVIPGGADCDLDRLPPTGDGSTSGRGDGSTSGRGDPETGKLGDWETERLCDIWTKRGKAALIIHVK